MTVPDYGSTPQVGKRRALHLLRSMSPEERRRLLRTIGQQNPQLRAALEEELVLFEDLVLLSDDELAQLVLRVWRHDPNLWAIALRQSSQALRNKVFRTMSASMRDRTAYRLETMPPRRLSDVLAAQKRILRLARELFGDILLDLRDTVR